MNKNTDTIVRTAEIESMQNGMNHTVYVIRYFETGVVVNTTVHSSYTEAEKICVSWYGNKKNLLKGDM